MNLEKLKSVLYTLDKISISGINNVNMMSGCMQVLQEVIEDLAAEENKPDKPDNSK